MQRELIKLHDAGIAIALCSKNDHANALDAIKTHAGIVLAPEHVAVMRIDWRDKAAMVREIAEELGFGLDSLVFLEDNPIERDWVRTALPDVLVPELPRDPALRPAFIASLDAFDRLELTDADVQRERSRDAARKRDAQARAATDSDAFLTSLGQQIEIARIQPSTLPRAAQLCEPIARRAVARGATALRMPYVATPRNGGVKAFLLRRGFIEQQSEQDSVFSLPLGADASLTEWATHVTLQGELVS